MTRIVDAVMEHAGRIMLGRAKVDEVSATVATWDACVAGLMRPETTPDPRLNDVAKLLWVLCSSRTVCTAMTEVPSLHFMGLIKDKTDGKDRGVVLIPLNWIKLFSVDPWLQLGAVMYSASKARDFWNKKIADEAGGLEVERRAKAYEAEFLRLAIRDQSKKRFKATAYQGAVLGAFGSFPSDLEYESKPFDLERAQAEFADYSERGIQAPA